MSNQGNAEGSAAAQDESSALAEFGYKQELPRVLKLWTNWAVGFAFISPVVGLFTVFPLGVANAGVMWIWSVPVVVFFQGVVAITYSGLAARWPIAGGIYQWSKRLVGPRFGWWAGWYYIAALILSASLTVYAGATFLGTLLNVDPTPTTNHVLLALGLLAVITFVNAVGLKLLKIVVNFGVGAEIIASILVAVTLLIFFRAVPVSHVVHPHAAGISGSGLVALVAAISSSAWVIVGFDACGSVAEETTDARRQVPRAMLLSVAAVGVVDLISAVGWTLAIPQGQYSGDPISDAVTSHLSSWSHYPFLLVILTSFTACGIATQGAATRVIYSFSRDKQLPGARYWKIVTKFNQSPTPAVFLVAVLSAAAFIYANGLNVLVNFTAGAYYIGFLCPVGALLIARLRGRWTDPKDSPYNYGRRWNTVLCVVAVVWLLAEIVNIAWPRSPGQAWYLNYGFFVGLGGWAVLGLLYVLIGRPFRGPHGNTIPDVHPGHPLTEPEPEPNGG
jgi:amino acid transporter